MFSITRQSQKTHVYRTSKNNGPVFKKLLFCRTDTINKCAWLQNARMKVDSNLKTSGSFFFQVIDQVSQIKSVKSDFS